MLYWYQIFYNFGNYYTDTTISEIAPKIHNYLFKSFAGLPPELGGFIKKKKGLEELII